MKCLRAEHTLYTYHNIAIVINTCYFAMKHHLNSSELYKGLELERAGSCESKR